MMAFVCLFIFTVLLFMCKRWFWGSLSGIITLLMLLN